jgi:hypothetical protein
VKLFYENLYSCKDSDLLDVDLEDIIKIPNVPRLDKTALMSFSDKISESEIYTVLKNMKNNNHQGVMDLL